MVFPLSSEPPLPSNLSLIDGREFDKYLFEKYECVLCFLIRFKINLFSLQYKRSQSHNVWQATMLLCEAYKVGFCAKPMKYCAKPTKKNLTFFSPITTTITTGITVTTHLKSCCFANWQRPCSYELRPHFMIYDYFNAKIYKYMKIKA